MASLTLTVAALNGSINATNGKAAAVLALVVAAQGGPVAGTDQEKIDYVAEYLARHLQEVAHGQKRRELRAEAEGNAETAIGAIEWGS